MQILYLGDIMGAPGIKVVKDLLPKIKAQYAIDLVIAQSENVSEGRGIFKTDFENLKSLGIDFFTGGNWSMFRDETISLLDDPNQPIIRPANYPAGTKGLGYKYIKTMFGKVLVISLLGKIVGRDSEVHVDNPLKVIDRILESEANFSKVATVVNFHGDFSSEKLIIGQYLDGRVSAVIGDHWHIPTADAMVLSNGTAHITDVGMCGSLDSSLGIKTSIAIDRWRDNKIVKNELETDGRLQLNGLLIEVDTKTGLSKTVKQLIKFSE
ncbi:MAG TPA: TIGR00282 family metallophosphoesterase [Candidatus Dormibacteraeota bacterium]|nr:TIGR00282 family metallophosphoesterase [Candidatus Dormibacteraeota bacterium]